MNNAVFDHFMYLTIMNTEAEFLGLPLPYPPAPPKPAYLREDDPCDDWYEEDDYEYEY